MFNSALGMQVQPKGKGFAKGKGKGQWKGAWAEEVVEEDENACRQKQVLQLENLLARTSNRLGCLGFEATKEKEKKKPSQQPRRRSMTWTSSHATT